MRLHGARFLRGVHVKVYGDPLVHPQVEGTGAVNPNGPRLLREGKRFAETWLPNMCDSAMSIPAWQIFTNLALVCACQWSCSTEFLHAGLHNLPITIYGTGKQTRSFCYVDDLVRAVLLETDGFARKVINVKRTPDLEFCWIDRPVRRIDNAGIIR